MQKYISEDELRGSLPFQNLDQAVLEVKPEDFGQSILAAINTGLATAINPDKLSTESFDVRFVSDTAMAGAQGGDKDVELVCLYRPGNKSLQIQVALLQQGEHPYDILAADLSRLQSGAQGDQWQAAQ